MHQKPGNTASTWEDGGGITISNPVSETLPSPDGSWHARVEAANARAFERIQAARVEWVDVRPAREVIGGLDEGVLLHAGPPLHWGQMIGCSRGAVVAAALYEGWAADAVKAEQLAARGEIRFLACNDVGAVAPVTGVVSPSMPLVEVVNRLDGTAAYSPFNEGLGRVVRYGAYDPEAIQHLHWIEKELAPVLRTALHRAGAIDLLSIMAEAVHMGDDCHNRCKAATRTLVARLGPHLVHGELSPAQVQTALHFILDTGVFFLNFSMAACKAVLRAVEGIENCGLVSTMAQNGHEFGIRVAGLPGRWFTAPAPAIRGLYQGTYTARDAAPATGDSVVTEAAGLGAFALAAAPTLVKYIGGSAADAVALTEQMYAITHGESQRFTVPMLGFRGTPTGIDVRKVAETGITPVCNVGIAHKEAGVGQVGAGYLNTPLAPFQAAWEAMVNLNSFDRMKNRSEGGST